MDSAVMELFKHLESYNGCGDITNGYKLVIVNMMKRVSKYKSGINIDFLL